MKYIWRAAAKSSEVRGLSVPILNEYVKIVQTHFLRWVCSYCIKVTDRTIKQFKNGFKKLVLIEYIFFPNNDYRKHEKTNF
jgi:hypothetical protein